MTLDRPLLKAWNCVAYPAGCCEEPSPWRTVASEDTAARWEGTLGR